MSSNPAVRITDVSKCFQTYQKPFHRLVQAFYRNGRKLYEEFWALRDIEFEIKQGETLGIVGKNGSGKSTLLQIVAGTMTATTGRVETNGRISAILELGAGFNPEFTGVENARLNASILGIEQEEISARLPEIIAFSELGDFVYRPVKTYSSGMYIRLAFSIAINLQPEILIIDEALAVGDMRFQRKCFRKLEDLKNSGVTIMFVTHATDSVVTHCDRALFLQDGKAVAMGQPKMVVTRYLESLFDIEQSQSSSARKINRPRAADEAGKYCINRDPKRDGCIARATYNASEYRWGSRNAEIIDYLLIAEDNNEIFHECGQGAGAALYLAVYFHQDIENIIYGLTIKTLDGTAVYGTNSELKKMDTKDRARGEFAIIRFQLELDLIAADYFLSVGVVQRDANNNIDVLDRRYDLIHIKVTDGQDSFGFAALNVKLEEVQDVSPYAAP